MMRPQQHPRTTTAPRPAARTGRPMRRGSLLLAVACAQCLGNAPLVLAQQSTTAPAPTAAAPTTQEAPAATTRPATGPGVATTRGGGILLNFKDASIDAVLDQLSEAAGFIVVRETPVSGRITLLSKQPVSREEAVSLLNTVLKTNGYAAIQMGRTLKVVARDRAKTANIPVRTGADPEQIAQTDELITQVVPVKSIDAVQLKNDLTPLIGADASVTANASSNTIVITDTSANIRRVVEIISSLDTHQSGAADVKVYQLEYASASGAAKLINDVFGQAAQQQSRGGSSSSDAVRSFFQSRFGGGPPGFGSSGGGSSGQPQSGGSGARSVARVTASSDDRTNTVVVSGPTDTLAIVERVIKELDANPVAEQSVFIYNLKNGQADALASVINSLINGTTLPGGTRAAGSRATGTNRTNNRNNRTNGNNRNANGGFGSGGFSSGGFGGLSGFGGTNGVTQRPLSAAASSAASDLAGQVTVVANADTNSLLVMTAPKNFDRVRLILDDLDRPVPQVLIKVLVAEVSHDNTRDLGAEFSVLNLRANGRGPTVGTDPTVTPFNPGFNTTRPPEVGGPGGLVARIQEENLAATFRALQTAGKLDVLSRPYILTSDNQEASIIIGQSVPIPTNSRVTEDGQIINSLQYRDVGIILNVTPHINPDGVVTLDVSPEVSSLTGQTVAITQGVGAPIFNTRSSVSRVAVVDGQTIVIGGMMDDRKTQTVSKVPLLGDIPGLGMLFRRTTDTNRKTELLFFLTPHVAGKPADLEPMTGDELKGTKLTPNAVAPGAFQEHMEGMRRGSATQPVGGPAVVPPTPDPAR